jgi:hypothetical protein
MMKCMTSLRIAVPFSRMFQYRSLVSVAHPVADGSSRIYSHVLVLFRPNVDLYKEGVLGCLHKSIEVNIFLFR